MIIRDAFDILSQSKAVNGETRKYPSDILTVYNTPQGAAQLWGGQVLPCDFIGGPKSSFNFFEIL